MKKIGLCLVLCTIALSGCASKNSLTSEGVQSNSASSKVASSNSTQAASEDPFNHPLFTVTQKGDDIVLDGFQLQSQCIDYIKAHNGVVEVPKGVTIVDLDVTSYKDYTKEVILPDTVRKLARKSLWEGGNLITHWRFPGREVEIHSDAMGVGIRPGIKQVIIELPESFSVSNIDELTHTERANGVKASNVVFYFESLGWLDDPNNTIPVVKLKIHKGSWADKHQNELYPHKQGRATMAKFEVEYVD